MAELIEALVARLGSLGVDLRPNQAVATIRAVGGGYEVVLDGDNALPAAAVVLATPAPVTARLVRDLCPAAATLLEEIQHASTATVSLAYRADDVGTPPPEGCPNPIVELRTSVGGSLCGTTEDGRSGRGDFHGCRGKHHPRIAAPHIRSRTSD